MSGKRDSTFNWFGYWLSGGFIGVAWIHAMLGGGTMLGPSGGILKIESSSWPYVPLFAGWLVLGLGRAWWEAGQRNADPVDSDQHNPTSESEPDV